MRDLRNFVKNEKNMNQQKNESTYNSSEKKHKIEQGTEEEVRKIVDDYSSMSEGDLMSELFREVEKGKQDGSISKESLKSFYDSVSPMLNSDQISKLQSILKTLKI